VGSEKSKEPLVAVLLALVLPGLGQVYAGRMKRGLTLLAINVLATVAALAYLVYPNTRLQPSLLLLLAPIFAFSLFVVIDAYRCVRAWNTQHNLVRSITAGKRIGLLFAILMVLLLPGPSQLIAQYVRSHFIASYKMPAGSMEPTLLPGDRLLVDKAIYRKTEPKRGDMIVFKYPEDPKRPFIKRLVGLPGETIEIRNEKLVINGEILQGPEGWKSLSYYNEGKYGSRGQVVQIPPNRYYVLGDNSASSHDSRFWGFVPRENVIGKAYKIFYPFQRSGPIDESAITRGPKNSGDGSPFLKRSLLKVRTVPGERPKDENP